MKAVIFIMVIFVTGCTKSDHKLEFVAIQHIGKGILNGDACKTLYREDGRMIKLPENFKLTPYEAIAIANEQLGYSCGNKFGSKILADKQHYYIVQLNVRQNAIIINGEDGSILSKGFMSRLK